MDFEETQAIYLQIADFVYDYMLSGNLKKMRYFYHFISEMEYGKTRNV